MGFFEDELGSLADADARRFAGGSFAEDRLGSVVGAVKRRRAVRAAGVGGVSVVGASALAVGAANLPWSSMGLGFAPAAMGTVVCTTSSPSSDGASSERTWGSLEQLSDGEPDMASFPDSFVSFRYEDGELAITDELTGAVTQVDLIESPGPRVVDQGISYLRQHADGTYSVPLSEGRVVTFRVVPYEKPEDAEVITLEYRYPSVDVSVDGPQAPAVTCVTTTPEHSASASPMPTVSVSPPPEPSAADAGVTWTWDPADPLNNPFQCGFVFPASYGGTSELRVTGDLTTAAAIRATFNEWYGNQAPTSEVAGTEELAYHATLEGGSLEGVQVTAADPASVGHEVLPSAVGMSFVAVRDGVVIGTIPTETNNAPGLAVDGAGGGGPLEAFLWDLDAFTPCGATTSPGIEVYAVAGLADAESATYSWTKVTE